jgi:small subunit ribosomal protein S35
MPIDQDWPSVVPAASTLRHSILPIPLRMGYERRLDKRPPPGKDANLELMKIPNFLHITPPAIGRHCAAIKSFTTAWPEALNENPNRASTAFPVRYITQDFCHSGNSLRDDRSRVVTLKINIDALVLDYHAKDKLLRLAGDRFDAKTNEVTITCDQCPSRGQNKEYAAFLLTALYFESWRKEEWESLKGKADMEAHFWPDSLSERKLNQILERLSLTRGSSDGKIQDKENVSQTVSDNGEVGMRAETGSSVEALIKKHIDAWIEIRNANKGRVSLKKYGDATRAVLRVPKLSACDD